MATILLSAAGAALGSGFGGTLVGLSGAVIGRAVGATLGRVIDQRILGGGGDAVEVGRLDRFRLMGASEGAAVPRIWGRVRVAGQVIWASRFQENTATTGSGKGSRPKTTQYSYSVSLAVALCEGEITGIGRVWADGNEIQPQDLNLRVYTGSQTQAPDPKIEAVEGAGLAPAYRGIAYVVMEDLDLTPYGSRVPQFSFEVIRPAQGEAAGRFPDLSQTVPGVCLIPGTGEYGLATTAVHYALGKGIKRSANQNAGSDKTDFAFSFSQLQQELPRAQQVALTVSWFGSDLRCGLCKVQPKVEQRVNDGVGMPWVVNGVTRADAAEIEKEDGRSIYGGTPADASVIEAITALRTAGKQVTFYPFVLMDQLGGNGLADPWTGAADQPRLPWRGRITTSKAPGQPGSPDRTAAAEAEVAAFFGTAQPAQFGISNGRVTYSGPQLWGYRRFVLHYARLCALAGGVECFCIGSEMRGLTQIRGAGDSFPAVAALRALASDVRAILGPSTRITYAADWSEYFGYHTGNNVYFHLDLLWADPAIDVIGIDNYMPLSDWRDGETHADAHWGQICNKDYLRANIAGGEGFEWYYDGPEGEAAQRRLPITDGAYGEDWIYRYKDLRGWWENQHHDRIDGVAQSAASPWVPMSKPIRFTEYGCAALDKSTNQPNRFLDSKSSESGLPRGSNGQRDDLIQLVYHQAMSEHWTDPLSNPVSPVYSGPMVDFAASTAWAWDARPFPAFPANEAVWGDGGNYDRGHWLNGRAANQQLGAVVAEITEVAGVQGVAIDGPLAVLRGYASSEVTTARSVLQPLMLAHAVETVERDGQLRFKPRSGRNARPLDAARLARSPDLQGAFEAVRLADLETPARMRIGYIEAEGSYAVRLAEAVFPDASSDVVAQSDAALVLTETEAVAIAERWMAEARVSRDTARFALPPSRLDVGAGDVVALQGARYRVDRIEQGDLQLVEAVRIDPAPYEPRDHTAPRRSWTPYIAPTPIDAQFLDLPLITGAEVPQAPYVAAVAQPWPGTVAVWSANTDDGYALNTTLQSAAMIGTTETPLVAHPSGIWDRGAPVEVRFETGTLESASLLDVLSGANLAVIGDGSAGFWEVFQFASAQLVAPKTYALSMRLRGQLGSDGIMPAVWPAGSTVVILSAALRQIDLPISARGLARHYRIGAASRGYDSAEVVHEVAAFQGIGLRPYGVAHLQARALGGDTVISWIRRTRIDGDSWQSLEVPLGEDSEAYVLRIMAGGVKKREVTVTSPSWTYTAAMRVADSLAGPLVAQVAQLSQSVGAGPFRWVVL